MNCLKVTLRLLVVFLSLTLAVSAQQSASTPPSSAVPRLVKYSGVVKDAVGKPRSGTVGITFAMYAEQAGGSTLWLETQNAELDEQGRYTVLLGAQTKDGLPLELFTSSEPRWLGVQVNLPGEVEQARVLLVSVPYALKAADAETLGGKPISAFVLAAGPSDATSGGKGIAPRLEAILAGGTQGVTATTSGGTVNFLAKFDNSGTNLINSQVFDNGTNVGIGTSTPGATLDVNGGARALSFGFSGNAAVPTNATATIFDQANVGPTFSGFNFSVRTGVTPANALNVDSNHNLSVAGGAQALSYIFAGNAAPPTDATATIFNQAFVGPTFSGLSFRVRTGAPTPADALTVDQNQKVGIGTTTPGQKLSVAGVIESTTGGFKFPDGTTQATAATGGGGGTITAVNTAAGSGLQGGVTSGAANLNLLTSCASGQILKWSGTAWACNNDLTAAGGGTLAFTVTLPVSTSIISGTCTTFGITATGATTSMAVVISPMGNPSTNGLNEIIWSAFVDATDHLTAQFCHFSRTSATATANQVFNIRVIN